MASILDEKVAKTAADYGLSVDELACDPNFADTAAFNEKYNFAPNDGANTILVVSRKVEPAKYAVCVVLASTRLDVNKKVTQLLDVKRASFADSETTRQLTGMEIGGVTAVGITDYPIFVDEAVMSRPKVVMGGGNRTSKLLLDPNELLKLPNVTVVADLAKPIEQPTMRTIICITTAVIWQEAVRSGAYTHSTITSSLEEVGFIHATTPAQTMDIIPRFSDQKDVMLLFIDADNVKAPVKFEAARSGRTGLFPHIYGPLNIDAVYATAVVEKDNEGNFVAPTSLLNAQA